MSFQILKINRAILADLGSLLSASAGYETSMADEIEYFESGPASNWFCLTSASFKPLGFIRSFDQGEWSQAEIFVLPTSQRALMATSLLQTFMQENTFPSGHRVRFDIANSDLQMAQVLKDFGLDEKAQTFFLYELNLPLKFVAAQTEPTKMVSAAEVAEALSALHPVKIEEAQSWIDSNQVRSVSCDGKVVAAAQVYEYGNSAEINRIATNLQFQRRGFSKVLMQSICNELSDRGVEKLFLKVEDVKAPAIAFYESFGFKRNEAKTQTWFSKYF